ncbi:putative acetamidase [Aspergillus undulatus]|uniref:putative acetamidase n=1 Tax=Aspergillus undulatus TaxID=1810928 RepID=UPI003CCCB425
MQSLLDSNPWNLDPGCIPISWRKDIAALPTRKLKLAIVYDDGVVRPQPPVMRAMREVARKLMDDGHEVTEWDTTFHNRGIPHWTKSVLADCGHHCRQLCSLIDEPLIQGMIVGTATDELPTIERESLEEEKYAFAQAYLSQWKDAGIDALLLPFTPWVGYRPKEWVRSSQWLGYTAVFNLLDYAGVTVPVTRADGGLDCPNSRSEGMREWVVHWERIRNEADRFNWGQYDIDSVKGMPVTVQIVGGRFGEEKAISVAKVIDGLFGR